jgi:hypothetical protein
MCANAHQTGGSRRKFHNDREGSPVKEGTTKMTKLFHSSEAAEIFALEHRFPVATVLMCILMAGSVGSAVLTLVAA